MGVVGRTDLSDATGGNHPHNTTISRNVAHAGSIYLKGFFGALVLAKQAKTQVVDNVFFDLPRNAIMINDGAHGGDRIQGNLFFSVCREMSNTGPIYTYDRLIYEFFDEATGARTVVSQPRTIRNNMFITNHGAGQYFWPVDHDDGVRPPVHFPTSVRCLTAGCVDCMHTGDALR